VPALIVMVVVAVWALFGKLASGEQDWRRLVSEVGNENPHRRWRAGHGLAQMLKADQESAAPGPRLTQNSELAGELAGLLSEQLERTSPDAEGVKHQAFLARILGFLDVPETVLPPLQEAMQPGRDLDVRRSAIASIALVAGRAAEEGRPVESPSLVDDLIAVSADPEPPLRHLGTYALGLMPGEPARRRLAVLVQNERVDAHTRVNAAVGLARHGSTEGLPLFRTIIAEAAGSEPADGVELMVLGNTLRAVEGLSDELTADQRTELADLLQPIAENHRDRRLRVDAGKVLMRLNGSD
jgi:hypothetical protein